MRHFGSASDVGYSTLAGPPVCAAGGSLRSIRNRDSQLRALERELWRRSSILGKRILLDGAPYDVIGVMPGGFAYPRREARLWTAMRFAPDEFEDRNDNYLDVIAKL